MTVEPPHSESAGPRSADRLYLDIAIRRADIQLTQIDSLDSKSSTLFAVGSGLLPIALGLFAVIVENPVREDLWSIFFLFCGITSYGLHIGVFIAGYRLQKWDTRPQMEQWREIFTRDPVQNIDVIQAWLGDAVIEGVLKNQDSLGKKIEYTHWSIYLLAAEVVLLTGANLLTLF